MAWNFQSIVLTIAILLLIVTLIFIGIALSKSKYTNVWPPITGDCPDYWVDLSGNGEACYNNKNLGAQNCSQSTYNSSYKDKKVMDFTTPAFSGDNGTCTKATWANKCGISWDGITYGVSNPCDTSTTTLT